MIVLVLMIILLFVGVGAWAGGEIFRGKNRDRSSGAWIGGLCGLFPLLLIVFLIVAATLPPLQEGEVGYLPSRPNMGVGDGMATSNSTAEKDIATQIKEAQQLHEQGLIDDDEFTLLKQRIINS